MIFGFGIVRKIFVSIVGFSILVFGFILVFLPGPAIVVIPIGLIVLAGEYLWAKKLLEKIRSSGKFLSKKIQRK